MDKMLELSEHLNTITSAIDYLGSEPMHVESWPNGPEDWTVWFYGVLDARDILSQAEKVILGLITAKVRENAERIADEKRVVREGRD